MKDPNETECADIVIIGAGVSGIGASRQLTAEFPDKKILILEARASIGGTWDLFRYPGVRSDSDLHTYAYDFKPWRHRSAIAEAPLIREYLDETVTEFGLDRILRLGHRVTAADWSSAEARWTLQVTVTDDAGAERPKTVKAGFVFSATGYYRYDQGYTPHFEGRDVFAGDILHPQQWPEGYDYSGKRVVIIGSGATAVTMLPAMLVGEGAAAHVTMLQRTPSYIASAPRVDNIALKLTKVLGPTRGYAATRLKNVWQDYLLVTVLSKFPTFGRKLLRKLALKELPAGFDVDTHFNPPYDPWDQRLCVTPDGEFFKALRDGTADVVTGHIERFTEKGILLKSGRTLEADVIVTATGLVMQLLGGIRPTVDGVPVKIPETVLYRGTLISGVPNWAMMLGYTKASWTLRLSNVCRLIIDVLRHMDATGDEIVVPVAPENLATQDVVDLSAGYMQRALAELPRQGTGLPWRMHTTFVKDNRLFKGRLIDESLRFSARTADVSGLTGVGAGS
ncbi:flavin-containing monooxygenase [Amycolatopsis australiensis]|uniref:Predicted flavoprotein CzcO associated with the cation diffusion facilitator CzcD n=1 Tax=Amycolatopsis australiensis TaxID=546364 RepID=A0A1K1SPU9_9PSEU|nr:NAD(P)/FAD-dependent oxidoreductase [Amycolatopsis australiensis]SFW86318.1 Predicted flavoprotein CzcO associated with the cation diffusion facilitator CzcD [Amycolatopsis australiensis]